MLLPKPRGMISSGPGQQDAGPQADRRAPHHHNCTLKAEIHVKPLERANLLFKIGSLRGRKPPARLLRPTAAMRGSVAPLRPEAMQSEFSVLSFTSPHSLFEKGQLLRCQQFYN